jgi:hypothetical protein
VSRVEVEADCVEVLSGHSMRNEASSLDVVRRL